MERASVCALRRAGSNQAGTFHLLQDSGQSLTSLGVRMIAHASFHSLFEDFGIWGWQVTSVLFSFLERCNKYRFLHEWLA